MTRSLGRVGMLLVLVLFFAAPAAANHVQCGDTITQDTTLDGDLVCAGDALTVSGDVTLDLGGHTIQGAGSGSAVTTLDGTIELRRGTIAGFGDAILAEGVDALMVDEMLIRRSGAGIDCAFVRQCTVQDSTIEDNVVGIDMEFVGESPALGGTVRQSVIRGNAVGLDLSASRAHVSDNRVVGNATGIQIDETTAEVSANVLADNSGDAVTVSFLSHAKISDNRIEGNGGNGVGVFGDHFFENTDAVVSGNQITRNGLDGILVLADGAHAVVEGNQTDRNGDDGIDVRLREGAVGFTVDTVVQSNKAYFNGDLGIHAVAGTTDAGGNKARHNGNPAQCAGVVCK